ncbi:MAG: hypothetical protein A3G32_03970 [Deltaproteobacteria bacterium RIFCSPLOWO2_12_FULL_40_28]|nr:MAG: hypothetical protein A3I69_08715 [Deltaproteobacteria bacterium RIFCSPLOWO2_02_FULL_40_36]OGQ55089.1 MAG: hypothetical protein A3G32_03970 [Deltaproteobacteria bacterium RIFCSPLOWO2_12_FULL_40_28]
MSFAGLMGLIVFFLVTYHIVFNSKTFQTHVKNTLNDFLNIEISWDEMHFNGATGLFYGKNLKLDLIKHNIHIELKEFKLSISPIYLLIKKIHLLELTADGLNIDMPLPEQKIDQKQKKAPQKNLENILDLIFIERAKISHVTINGQGEFVLKLENLEANTLSTFFFYRKGLEVALTSLNYRSPRFDVFLDHLELEGKGDVFYDIGTQKNKPFFQGGMIFTGLTYALNKKPNPWNEALAWHPSLTNSLKQIYSGMIPENRSIGYLDKVSIPIKLDDKNLNIKNAIIQGLNGIIAINGNYDFSGQYRLTLKTLKPIMMAYLPVGKAKLKNVFEFMNISIESMGEIAKNLEGHAKAKLNINLTHNLANPLGSDLTLTSEGTYYNGLVNIPETKVTLGSGNLKAKTSLDLNNQKIRSDISGENLDVQTVVHFFSSIDIPGIAGLTGMVSGALNNPRFDLDLKSDDFGYESLRFGSFNGKLNISDQNLRLTGESLLEGSGQGNLDLKIESVFRSSNQTVNLNTTFNNLPAGPLLKTKALTGQVNGNFNLKKQKQFYDGNSLIEASEINWYQIPLKKAQAKLFIKDKNLTIKDIALEWGEIPQTLFNESLTFHMNQTGSDFEGKLLPNLEAKGHYDKSRPDELAFSLKATNASLLFLAQALPFESTQTDVSGNFEGVYHFKNPMNTTLKSQITQFILMGNQEMRLVKPSSINFENSIITWQNTALKWGDGEFTLNGPLGFEQNSHLQVKGNLPLKEASIFLPFLSDAEGVVRSDLLWENSFSKPKYTGKMGMDHSFLRLRGLRGEYADIVGELELGENKIIFHNLKTLCEDSPMIIDGWIEYDRENKKLIGSNVAITAREMPLYQANVWRALTDANITLIGSGSNIKLAGSLNVVEGLYYKDYSLSQFVLKPVGIEQGSKENLLPGFFDNLNFDLGIKSTGDFEVKNNLAHLSLSADLRLKGTTIDPILSGTVNVTEGEFLAFGLNFENATGFATFNENEKLIPLIEFNATYDIQDYEIIAKIKGYAHNLQMDLESKPALNKNEIVSLIAYGRTPEQLTGSERNLFTTSAIASQVVGMLHRPLSKATKLDIIKLESDYQRQEETPSRFSIGKRISDRFSLSFTSDLSLDESFKGFDVEYKILDNLLMKSTKDTGTRYHFDLTWRLTAY